MYRREFAALSSQLPTMSFCCSDNSSLPLLEATNGNPQRERGFALAQRETLMLVDKNKVSQGRQSLDVDLVVEPSFCGPGAQAAVVSDFSMDCLARSVLRIESADSLVRKRYC